MIRFYSIEYMCGQHWEITLGKLVSGHELAEGYHFSSIVVNLVLSVS